MDSMASNKADKSLKKDSNSAKNRRTGRHKAHFRRDPKTDIRVGGGGKSLKIPETRAYNDEPFFLQDSCINQKNLIQCQ